MKRLFLLMALLVLLSGCAAQNTAPATAETGTTSADTEQPADADADSSIGDRLENISFTLQDGNYTRSVTQEDAEFTEMFVPGKDSFVRISGDEDEQEVFSYNYKTTDFTYLYYLAGEMAIKLVYNIDTDKVTEDEDDFFELLQPDALALKQYFEALIEAAGIGLEELIDWEVAQ